MTEKSKKGQGTTEAASSHARARPSVAARVDHIVGMMERFEWVRGKSGPELAKLWGVALPTVEGHAAEASRRVVGDKDEAIRDITVGARRLFLEAVKKGDQKGAKAIGDLWADIAGAKAPSRQDIAAAVYDVSDATPAKAREIMKGLFSKEASPEVQAASANADDGSEED